MAKIYEGDLTAVSEEDMRRALALLQMDMQRKDANKERSARQNAKVQVMLRKARDAGITATDAEIDEYLAAKN